MNYFLQNANNPAIPASTRNNYIGIARFFRAWFYFDKVKRFGDVPWINRPFDVADTALFSGRVPRAVIMDSIISDLDFACQNITSVSEATRSLITKSVAYGFKSRVCLFEGTFRKYHDVTGDLAQGLGSTAPVWLNRAADAAKWVIDNGGYRLNTGDTTAYRQLFTATTPNANEVMLAATVNPSLSVYNDANWYWTSATYGSRVSLIRTFVNTYLRIDGTPFTSLPGYDTMRFSIEVQNRDKRLQQTIRMGNYQRLVSGTPQPAPPVFSYTYTGYQPIKWTLDNSSLDGGTNNTNSPSMMRYAEILLNWAEAKGELGTLTDADWNNSIGALRRRANITGNTAVKPTVADVYLKTNYYPELSDPTLLEVRRERGIELVFEGFRYDDLLRWKKGNLLTMIWNGFYVPGLLIPLDLNNDGKPDVRFYQGTAPAAISGVTDVNVSPTLSTTANPQLLKNGTYGELTWLTNITRDWQPKNYLYPIPENDLLMNPKLGQNPGW